MMRSLLLVALLAAAPAQLHGQERILLLEGLGAELISGLGPVARSSATEPLPTRAAEGLWHPDTYRVIGAATGGAAGWEIGRRAGAADDGGSWGYAMAGAVTGYLVGGAWYAVRLRARDAARVRTEEPGAGSDPLGQQWTDPADGASRLAAGAPRRSLGLYLLGGAVIGSVAVYPSAVRSGNATESPMGFAVVTSMGLFGGTLAGWAWHAIRTRADEMAREREAADSAASATTPSPLTMKEREEPSFRRSSASPGIE